jgi:hypothetical protein
MDWIRLDWIRFSVATITGLGAGGVEFAPGFIGLAELFLALSLGFPNLA